MDSAKSRSVAHRFIPAHLEICALLASLRCMVGGLESRSVEIPRDVAGLVRAVRVTIEAYLANEEKAWSQALSEAPRARALEETLRDHHEVIRQQCASLDVTTAKVVTVRGANDIVVLQLELEALQASVAHHFWKEERELFSLL